MGFIKNALIGIAIYKAVKYLTQQDALGRSKMDEIKDNAPEWIEKAKVVASDIGESKLSRDL